MNNNWFWANLIMVIGIGIFLTILFILFYDKVLK